LQKKKLLFGIIIFFIISPSILVLTTGNYFILPQDQQISTTFEDTYTTIGYNLITNTEEMEYFRNMHEESSFQSITSPFLGNKEYSSNPQISYPFIPDDRVRINDTSNYPWSTISKLYITAADSTQFIGSGAIIDEFHVLTCGHCVYLHGYGGWASEVKVVPGKFGPTEPFGHAFATYLRTYPEWTGSAMPQHDWAVITLDRAIGNLTGWMGRKTAAPSDPIYLGTLHTAGYPGDLDFGEYMYYDSDVGELADNFNHWFWMDTAAGQSGGPIWEEVNGSYYILTINAYEYENGTYANFGTRLNQDKFDQINVWLAEDTIPNNPNGLNPELITIIIVIAVIGVAVVVVSIVIISRKSRPKVSLTEPFEEDITHYNSESIPLFTPEYYSQNFGFCPNCGRAILRDTQQFCSNCGFNLK
jgi:V8-like Glu-specific endopeptidase